MSLLLCFDYLYSRAQFTTQTYLSKDLKALFTLL